MYGLGIICKRNVCGKNPIAVILVMMILIPFPALAVSSAAPLAKQMNLYRNTPVLNGYGVREKWFLDLYAGAVIVSETPAAIFLNFPQHHFIHDYQPENGRCSTRRIC